MKEVLSDILKHTHGLGIFEAVKIVGEDDSTTITSMDINRSVMFTGVLTKSVSEFKGLSGLGNLSYLHWLLHWGFMDQAKISVIRQTRNGNEVPVEMQFDSGKGDPWFYRFMSPEVVKEMITGSIGAVEWNATAILTRDEVSLFSAAASGMAKFNETFNLSTKGTDLVATFGTGGNAHRGSIVLGSDIKGSMGRELSWPIAHVLSILNLGKEELIKVSVCDRGVLRFTVESEHGQYEYLLPAMMPKE